MEIFDVFYSEKYGEFYGVCVIQIGFLHVAMSPCKFCGEMTLITQTIAYHSKHFVNLMKLLDFKVEVLNEQKTSF